MSVRPKVASNTAINVSKSSCSQSTVPSSSSPSASYSTKPTATTPPAAAKHGMRGTNDSSFRTPPPRPLTNQQLPSRRQQPTSTKTATKTTPAQPRRLVQSTYYNNTNHRGRTSPSATTTTTTTTTPSQRVGVFPKTIFFIRHGESLGQACASLEQRVSDDSLRDCGLSPLGQQQARHIPQQLRALLLDEQERSCHHGSPKSRRSQSDAIQLVVTSPLTRAMQTTLLAFGGESYNDHDAHINDEQESSSQSATTTTTTPSTSTRRMSKMLPVICHYDLREIGNPIPENIPRPMNDVLRDLGIQTTTTRDPDSRPVNVPMSDPSPGSPLHPTTSTQPPTQETLLDDPDCTQNNEATIHSSHYPCPRPTRILLQWDVTTHQPPDWPRRHDASPKVLRRDRIQQFVSNWLTQRPETCIAVVCHYHVIRAALAMSSSSSSSRFSRLSSPGVVSTDQLIKPQNAVPIKCILDEYGNLVVVENGDT